MLAHKCKKPTIDRGHDTKHCPETDRICISAIVGNSVNVFHVVPLANLWMNGMESMSVPSILVPLVKMSLALWWSGFMSPGSSKPSVDGQMKTDSFVFM